MGHQLFEQYSQLETFCFRRSERVVRYVGTMPVADGVECDLYDFKDDDTCDLGIIKIEPGFETPRQLIVAGDCTVEGLLAGAGTLVVGTLNDTVIERHFAQTRPGGDPFDRCLCVGETMQWQANVGFPLVAYEVCYPPWDEDRFQSL